MPRAIDVGLKGHAILIQLSEFGERHDLEPAGIGQDRPRPVHEFMQAAERRDPLRARPQHEMIGVGEHDIGAERLYRFGMHRLDGASRADRHEGRRTDRSAGSCDKSRARRPVLAQNVETENTRHAPFSAAAGNSKHASP